MITVIETKTKYYFHAIDENGVREDIFVSVLEQYLKRPDVIAIVLKLFSQNCIANGVQVKDVAVREETRDFETQIHEPNQE